MYIIGMEIWKDIKGYEGLYQVSDEGTVRSTPRMIKSSRGNAYQYFRGGILKHNLTSTGYHQVQLLKDGKRKTFMVARLVLDAFAPTDDMTLQANHINENKDDNRLCNLEWTTPKENANWGTRNKRSGEKRRKAVIQMNLDGTEVAVWDSLTTAAKSIGTSRGNIYACCNFSNRTIGGYKWKYVSQG